MNCVDSSVPGFSGDKENIGKSKLGNLIENIVAFTTKYKDALRHFQKTCIGVRICINPVNEMLWLQKKIICPFKADQQQSLALLP